MRRILIMALALSGAIAANTATLPAPAAAAEQTRACKVVNVAVLANRIHIRCNPVAGGGLVAPPIFFAVELNNPMADKAVALAAQALIANRELSITYEGTPGANPPGCLVQDCRRLTSVWLQ